MATLVIWYSVRNGGDGSAYSTFFESKKLAQMDQEMMEEGWGEECIGSLTIEGDNIKVVRPHVITVNEQLKYLDEIIEKKWYSKYMKEKASKYRKELINEIDEEPNVKWYKGGKMKREEEWEDENEKLKSFNDDN